jgi:uncharacterized protein
MPAKRSYLNYILLFSLSPNAFATGIDCNNSVSKTETIICSRGELINADLKLADIYSKLFRLTPKTDKADLQKAQKQWLLTRDNCKDEVCLNSRYFERVSELDTALQAAKRSAIAYQPDNVDSLALTEIQQAVKKQLGIDQELPLEKALQAFEIKVGLTSFENILEDGSDDIAKFPTKRPKGVTANEWKALQNSGIEAGGENGHASYTLLDMDGDGKRDLIVDSYMGGTGLFNYVSTMQRKANKFVGNYTSLQKEDGLEHVGEADYSLYLLNGRGSNESATWVKLQGRIYVAYRSSYYGIDNISLLRPLVINEKSPVLSVHYQYTFTIPKNQIDVDPKTEKTSKYTLDTKTHAALLKGLKFINSTIARDNVGSVGCPAPKDVSEDDRLNYSNYGPGHYTFEIVGDFPVWIDKTCYLGRLIDWFGAYSKADGLHMLLSMKLPNSHDDQEKNYDVEGRRKVIKIESGVGKVNFGGS